jgi:hypothetical protein
MQNIKSTAELKNAIQLLEAEQTEKERILKEQVHSTYESFKPANLIAGILDDVNKSPYLVDNVLGTALGLVTGFYSQKLILNPSGSRLKKLLGVAMQFGVTNLVARHSDAIRTVGRVAVRLFGRKKRLNRAEP